jgi:hypothetical protein
MPGNWVYYLRKLAAYYRYACSRALSAYLHIELSSNKDSGEKKADREKEANREKKVDVY